MIFFSTLAYASKLERIESVYLDDVLVFSETLEDHIKQLVRTSRSKAETIQMSFWSRNIITANFVKLNPKLVSAVKNFPVPKKINETNNSQDYLHTIADSSTTCTSPVYLDKEGGSLPMDCTLPGRL